VTDELVDAMAAVVPDLTVTDAADAVWLLSEIIRRLPPAGPATGPEPVPSAPQEPPPLPIPAPTGTPPVDVPPNRPARADWYLPTGEQPPPTPAEYVPLRSPGVSALLDRLQIGRALRPFRRRVLSKTSTVIDEEETVRLGVDSGVWAPVHRPTPGRWLDLALVVDDSASMVIWRRVIAEFRDLIAQVGAFADIRVWYCDTDVPSERLTISPGAGRGRRAHDIRELLDPTGRRVVLVLSDCVGVAWSSGAMARALQVWGGAGPVAIVQTLPQRMWEACGPEFVPATLSARRPAVPNTGLVVKGPYAAKDAGVAVPVLALDPRSIAPWAAMVGGAQSVELRGSVVLAGSRVDTAASDRTLPWIESPRDADALIRRFRKFASTDAVRLAVCLAGAPLSLPVMRLVQQVMLPGSRTSVLAEVFLGGLLRRVRHTPDSSGPVVSDDAEAIEFDFMPGVRDRLLASLPRHERVAVLTRVGDFLGQRLGSSMDFRGFLAASGPVPEVLRRSRPFAQVALQVLRDMGGRYRDAADRLRREVRLLDPDDTETGMHAAKAVETPKSPLLMDASGRTATPVHYPVGENVSVSTSAAALPHHAGDLSRKPDIFGGLPQRNPHFTGRKDLLERLHGHLNEGSSQLALVPHALHGLGGVGKTQLAVEFAYRYAPEYDLVWWVPAESETSVRASLSRLAEEMGLPRSQDVDQNIQNVRNALQQARPYARWLLVFDNAGEVDELKRYLPVPVGHVVVTSRNSRWSEVATELKVDVFTRSESIALVQRRGVDVSAEEANDLADKLGDLPLAIDQAAAWQAETGMPVRDLVDELDRRMHDLLSGQPTGYPTAVLATWDLSFSRLQEQTSGAADILELCAFFGPEPLRIPVLREGRRADLGGQLGQVLQDGILLRRAIRDLGRLALAKVDAKHDTIEVHRIVQAVVRDRMSPERQEETRTAVHRIIADANPTNPDDPTTWGMHSDLTPHITPSGVIDAASENGKRAALDQIRYRFMRGDYVRSRRLAETALSRWRETLGHDHELTLICQRHLALAMREMGDWREAARLNADTLERMRAKFGADHEHTLATANSAGADLRLAGRFTDAKELDDENLARHRRRFASDDPELLRTMNNVAVDLRLLGDFAGALKIDRLVLDRHTDVSGPDHPETFLATANVARDLFDAGDYTEANSLLTDALPRMQRRLGEDARVTLIAKRVLVMVLRRLGNTARARELAEELYNAASLIYRPDHERRLSATVTYANALLAVGERAVSRPLAEQALADYRHTFGEKHPFTLATAIDVAAFLRAAGEVEAARAIDADAVEVLSGVLGDTHPYTLVALNNLSHDYAIAHDYVRAREYSELAYRRSVVRRGEFHPETLICGLNYAIDMRATGSPEQATAQFDEVQRQLQLIFGQDHPLTRSAAQNRRAETDIEVWAS
jgi:hypothetical protein